MHFIGQSNIRVNGGRAAAETYFIAYHTRRDAGLAIDVAAGRYADMLEKRGGKWKLLDRAVVMDWVETRHGLENSALALDGFVNGTRDSADVSYRAYEWAMQNRERE